MQQQFEYEVALWPRQRQAFESPATEILFGGASSGGKSHLIREALIVWCLQIPGLQCAIFRKHYDDVIGNHLQGPTGFKARLAPLGARGLVKIVDTEIRFLLNGSMITLRHCMDERDLEKEQGKDRHVLVIDEATQILERYIRFLRGWVRMPKEMQALVPLALQGRFPRIIYTANPIGPSVGYFRREFVDARKPFEIAKASDKEGGFLRQYIPSRIEDNPSVDAEAQRMRLRGIGGAALADALEKGNWKARIGDFFPEWNEDRHVVDDFIPPAHWFRFRSHDWGTAEPFCVYWIAVSDGESFVDEQNRQRWYPRGAFIYYREWYGCDPEEPAKGNRMRNEEIAGGILLRSMEYEKRVITLTDNLPFQDRGGETIAEVYARCGVILTLGDTSRVPGWSQVRSRLIGIEIDSNNKDEYGNVKRVPMIFFVRSCKAARDYMPSLGYHPSEGKGQDAMETGEATHACDTVRIGCMARTKIKDLEIPEPQTANIKNEITFDQAVKIVTRTRAKTNGSGW